MFNCHICGRTSKEGEAANKVVLETRPKTYKNQTSEKTIKESQGREIVKEVLVCGNCKKE